MKHLQILRATTESWGDRTIEISVKRVHAPGGIKRLRLVWNGFSHRGGMFGYDSITVSYAWDLISVFMCYPQGDGFNTSLSRLLSGSDPL